jgi:hypothetical protein
VLLPQRTPGDPEVGRHCPAKPSTVDRVPAQPNTANTIFTSWQANFDTEILEAGADTTAAVESAGCTKHALLTLNVVT